LRVRVNFLDFPVLDFLDLDLDFDLVRLPPTIASPLALITTAFAFLGLLFGITGEEAPARFAGAFAEFAEEFAFLEFAFLEFAFLEFAEFAGDALLEGTNCCSGRATLTATAAAFEGAAVLPDVFFVGNTLAGFPPNILVNHPPVLILL
jgi:hypothetical protein